VFLPSLLKPHNPKPSRLDQNLQITLTLSTIFEKHFQQFLLKAEAELVRLELSKKKNEHLCVSGNFLKSARLLAPIHSTNFFEATKLKEKIHF
jgi:hypothetical protein